VPTPSSSTTSPLTPAQLTALQNCGRETAKQWQRWYWVCVGGMVLFLPTIFLIKGRWSPGKPSATRRKYERLVTEELARLSSSPGSPLRRCAPDASASALLGH